MLTKDYNNKLLLINLIIMHFLSIGISFLTILLKSLKNSNNLNFLMNLTLTLKHKFDLDLKIFKFFLIL